MDEDVLRWFRDRVRTREYVMTVHAEEEMAADGYTIYDVEQDPHGADSRTTTRSQDG